MFDYQRQQSILHMLKQEGSMTTARIAQALYVSQATVRRDLARLEQMGSIRRSHGGASLLSGPESEIPLETRDRSRDLEKQVIAAKALQQIRDGDTIFLDASSTVARLIPMLAQRQNLVVVTNGPKAILELAALHIRTFSTGGSLLDNSLAFVGREAEQFLGGFNADLLFFSCRGISEEGYLTDSSLEEANMRKAMLRHAKRKFLLCDSSKYGNCYTYNICHREELDGVIDER